MPVQLPEPARPEPRPGRDPRGKLRVRVIFSRMRGGVMDGGAMTMANWAGNKAPGERKSVRTTLFLPGALFY